MAKDRMSFASGEKQASRMMQKLHGTVVQSVRSVANYEAA
jgi:hypothetical protein